MEVESCRGSPLHPHFDAFDAAGTGPICDFDYPAQPRQPSSSSLLLLFVKRMMDAALLRVAPSVSLCRFRRGIPDSRRPDGCKLHVRAGYT